MTHDDISDAEIEAVKAVIVRLFGPAIDFNAPYAKMLAEEVPRAAILASRAALLAEGKKVVAREPIEAMKRAYWDALNDDEDAIHPAVALRAMWDAAP